MMKRLIIYFVVLTLIGCDRQADKSVALNENLESTFQNSKTVLTNFMDVWSKESLTMTNERPTELELECFGIYKEIFSPFDFKKFGWTRWTDWTPYFGTEFIVVQSEIPYKIVDTVDTLESDYVYIDTLKNFLPKVNFDNVKTLYLANQYQRTFKQFLGDPQNEIERDVFRQKKEFLNSEIPTSLGYNWRAVLTQPTIDGICISKDFKEATVDFTIMQSGLRSYLIKEDNKWTLKTTKTTWVE
jgi:hypothetical protein